MSEKDIKIIELFQHIAATLSWSNVGNIKDDVNDMYDKIRELEQIVKVMKS